MIIYSLLKAILYILGIVSSLFGELIPDLPDAVLSVLNTISTMISGALSFFGYFFEVPVVVGLVTLTIAWHGFSIVKDAVMKVIGHFFAN